MSRVLSIIEYIFWVASALLMLTAAFVTLGLGAWKLYMDFGMLNEVLTKNFFYAIICFELFQISRVRIEGRSHKIILYHFIVMATLTFGREIFLIHNLGLEIVIGFVIMIGVYIAFYTWRVNSTDLGMSDHKDELPS